MNSVPITLQVQKALRLHIGIFGCRNAGKSSLINRLTNQELSIVSDVPGTTTDPVEKACELHPIGPVVLIDTAGIDDTGALGAERVRKSLGVLSWMDLALLVVDAVTGVTAADRKLLKDIRELGTPAVVVFNQADRVPEGTAERMALDFSAAEKIPAVACSAKLGTGIEEVRAAIVKAVEAGWEPDQPLVSGLIPEGRTAILVVPIDFGAPKGRLIPPQVQSIRELLDQKSRCLVVLETQVADVISELKVPPAIVITDSQAVKRVAAQVPPEIPLTTFSILMARSKSDLAELARGAAVLPELKPGAPVLICETCSHNPQGEDIGRVKIPNWLAKNAGGPMKITVAVSKDFPTDLKPYRVVIQCGGCMVTRRHMLARLRECRKQGIPMTNYGIAISHLQGVLERTLSPFPEALEAWREAAAARSDAA